MPTDTHPQVRQWMLNVGQDGPGAFHWIFNRNNRVQIGTWGPYRGGFQFSDAPGFPAAKTAATVYSKHDGEYTLWVNGQLAAYGKRMDDIFSVTDTNIGIGGTVLCR